MLRSSMMKEYSSSSSSEIQELESFRADANNQAEDGKIFVAVGKNFRENKRNLTWAIRFLGPRAVVLVHVHCPEKCIPMLGGKFPVNLASPEKVRIHRLSEQKSMNNKLEKYIRSCNNAKVHAEKLVIEMDNIVEGIIEVISQHQITRLVMGAAADRFYSVNMKVPRSKKATTLHNEAPESCKIWFVCRGNLICTRESLEDVSRTSSNNPDQWEGIPSRSWSGGDEVINFDNHDGSASMTTYSVQTDGVEADDKMMNRLRQAFAEVEDYKLQAYQESCKRSVAERETVEAEYKEKLLEKEYSAMIKQVEKLKESIAKLTVKVESIKIKRAEAQKELESALELKTRLESYIDSYSSYVKDLEGKLSSSQQLLSSVLSERDETFEEIKKSHLLASQLETQLDPHVSSVNDLEKKLASAHQRLDSLQSERDMLQQELDVAVKVVEDYRLKELNKPSANFLDFSFSELEKATQGFKDSLKLGEQGYGSIYKGFLRHTTVTVIVPCSHNWQSISEFQQKVEIISKVRHPNVVTLIGVCSEIRALVYEYIHGRSLEDHLNQVNNAPSLSWQARLRIASDICSALIFLHSNKTQRMVHGDLNPSNILLDANLTSKLSDFGISDLLTESASTHNRHCQTNPEGIWGYKDPETLITGELTIQSDIYSFGKILLRLLTIMPPFGIVGEVKKALAGGRLQSILDPTAGEWPYIQAEQLAELGLRCCEISWKMRLKIESEAWTVIRPMMGPLLKEAPSFSLGPNAEINSHFPSYFICPISREIMMDPQVASDGYTYEGEAIKRWLEKRGTSPMTNLTLLTDQLIPNLALRSVIKEWLESHEKT